MGELHLYHQAYHLQYIYLLGSWLYWPCLHLLWWLWCVCVCASTVSSTGPTMRRVLVLHCMSWGTHLTWLIHRLEWCHEASMTSIVSSLLYHLSHHFEAWHRHVMCSAHAVRWLAVPHKALFDDLLYVIISHFLCWTKVSQFSACICKENILE